MRASCPRRREPGSGAACSCLLSCLRGPRARAHTHPPHSPSHTQIHTDTWALPCLSCSRWACLPGTREPARAAAAVRLLSGRPSPAAPGSGGGVVPRRAAARSSSPPPHAVPRPGRLYPMRSGVAGRWGVFLFWVEVEAEEREELATSSRPRCQRRGKWRRPSLSREVPPPR